MRKSIEELYDTYIKYGNQLEKANVEMTDIWNKFYYLMDHRYPEDHPVNQKFEKLKYEELTDSMNKQNKILPKFASAKRAFELALEMDQTGFTPNYFEDLNKYQSKYKNPFADDTNYKYQRRKARKILKEEGYISGCRGIGSANTTKNYPECIKYLM